MATLFGMALGGWMSGEVYDLTGSYHAAFVNGIGWNALNVTIMFALPNEHEPFDAPAFTGSFYINPDDVDAMWERVKDKARICYPIDNFDYGMREFAIYDNNGYLLQFGEATGAT